MNGMLNQNIERRRAYSATGRDFHPDVPLSNLVIGYRPATLIADQIYPGVPVDKETGTYYVWDKAALWELHNAERSRGTAAKEIQFKVSSGNYVCLNFALRVPNPFEDLANADAQLRLRETSGMLVKDALSLAWEDRLAVLLTTGTNHCSNTNLTFNWGDVINGTPVTDIFNGIEAIRRTTGLKPNKAVISEASWLRASRHPEIIDFIRGKGDSVGGGAVTEEQFARAFNLKQLLVGGGIKNTAPEGAAAGTFTDVWTTAFVLLYVADNPSIMSPSHGYTFQWTPEGFPGQMAAEVYQNRERKVEFVEVHQYQDEVVTGTDLGFLITNA